MSETTYEVLARLRRDNAVDLAAYIEGEYAQGWRDGLMAGNTRIRAAMAGLPRPGAGPEWRGTPPEPPPDAAASAPSGGRIIDAEYSTVAEAVAAYNETDHVETWALTCHHMAVVDGPIVEVAVDGRHAGRIATQTCEHCGLWRLHRILPGGPWLAGKGQAPAVT